MVNFKEWSLNILVLTGHRTHSCALTVCTVQIVAILSIDACYQAIIDDLVVNKELNVLSHLLNQTFLHIFRHNEISMLFSYIIVL